MPIRSLSFDAKDGKTIRGKFKPSQSAEQDFFRALKKVAITSGHLVDNHTEGTKVQTEKLNKALKEYSELITPWAQRQAAKLLEQVQKSNKRAYQNKSKAIGAALKIGVGESDVGAVAFRLLNEQVALIKSIPIEAGLRAQKLAFEAAMHGTRAEPNQDTIEEIKKQLGFSTEAAISRAQLIARTETARANAAINQSRAMSVGSDGYRWRNSGDGAVRDAHKIYHGKRLDGMIFKWSEPPTLDDGMTGHPGTFPNCRCYAEPFFADE